jgi:hypothetical protein
MQKFFHQPGVWLALLGLTLCSLAVPATTLEEKKTGVNRAAATAADNEELLALLPESDLVAVIDIQRVFTDLLPRLKGLSTFGIGKTVSELETLAKLAGIEPKQIQAAVLGVKMTETLSRGSGVLLLQGVDVDAKKISEAAKSGGGELKTTEQNGKSFFTLSVKNPGAPADAKADAKPDEIYFALLDNRRVAIGDQAGLKALLAGGAKKTDPATLSKALKETKASGLVRFAGNLPEALREMLASQGELFTQVAAVKLIFGSFDLNADNTATLDGRLRTASSNDAAQLKESLNGLISLGQAFLGGSDDPTMKLYGQLINQVKLGGQGSDVSLLLVLPKELMEKLGK